MPPSKPTRARAFGLRIVSRNNEEWEYFPSYLGMARAFSLRLFAMTQRLDHATKVGTRAPFTRLDEDGLSITCRRETPYQAEHTHFGSIWRIRTEWTRFEAFGVSGNQLKIQNVLNAFDLNEHPFNRKRLGAAHRDRGHGPVQGIHKSRGGSDWFRSVSTANEIRMNALMVEGEVPPRAARQKGNLPTSWDDFYREPHRSWKSQRKTHRQWKPLADAYE